MTSPNAAKGKRWERDVRDFLAGRHGRAVLRPHQEGFKDVGDLHLYPFTLQCKDEARIDLPRYLRAAETQRVHAGMDFGAAVIKARRAPTSSGYVAMTLDTFSALLDRLADAESELRRTDPYAYGVHLDIHTHKTEPETKE